MRQILPKIQTTVLYATGSEFWGVTGGGNHLSSTFGPNVGLTSLPWAATFRNIALFCRDTSRTTALTLTLRKGGVATALSVSLPVGQSYAVTSGVDVACVAQDVVDYRLTGTATLSPGYIASFSVEQESEGNFFGLPGAVGGKVAGSGWIGGAFGNGLLEDYVGQSFSNTASICSVPGTMTKIALRDWSGVNPVGGSWTAYVTKNGILQDGSGGTVNTAVTLDDAEVSRFTLGTISLPVTPPDICDIVLIRNTTTHGFGNTMITVGIGYVPTTAGWFMLTGGNNTNLRGSGTTTYAFTGLQDSTDEGTATVPIGAEDLVARGLYVIRGSVPTGAGPGVGQTFTHTLLSGAAEPYVAGSATDVNLVLGGTTGAGSVTGLNVGLTEGMTATLRHVPSAGASVAGFYWGLALQFAEPVTFIQPWYPDRVLLPQHPLPPAVFPAPTVPGDTPTTAAGRVRRLRRAPHLSREQYGQFHSYFELDMEVGIGLPEGQGEDPQVMLRWSDDGGKTWSNEYWTTAGVAAAFSTRVTWNRLGYARDRIYELVVSDPVPWRIANACVGITGARH